MSKRSRRRVGKASAAQERARANGGRVVPLQAPVQSPPPPSEDVLGWFGPGTPPAPSAPADVKGRRFDYPVGVNQLQQPRPYEPITFHELRALADGYDLLRLIIEKRKDQISRLKFTFSPRDPKQKIGESGELFDRAKKYGDLFRRPDRDQFWGDWIRNLLEDLLVLDAPTVHVRRTVGGDVYSLDQLDGATIKRVVDDYGRTPEAPWAAYQQVLKGLPAVNYSRMDLVYRPRNLRVHKIYGYSPVEQVIMTVNIALRRQMWQLAYFTHGNVPDSLIGVPSTWTPDQIRQFQDWFDGLLQGNSQERRAARFVPGEVAKSYVPTKEAEIFGAAEEWLARVVCFCFGISHQALVKEVNRATAETSMEQAMQDGMAPIMNWVKGLVDSILMDQFGENDLELAWVDDKELDPKVQSEIHDRQVGKLRTVNEIRKELGEEPDPSPEANMLGTFTADGFVPLNTDLAIQLKQKMTEAFPQPEALAPGEEPADEGDEEGPEDSEGRAAPEEGEADGSAEKAKLSAAPVQKGLVSTSPLRPSAQRIRRSLESSIAGVLSKFGAEVAEQVGRMLDRHDVRKAEDDEMSDEDAVWLAQVVAGQLDLDGLDEMIDATEDDLRRIWLDSGRVALAQVGATDVEDLFDRVNDGAVAYARSRSAELVGKRVLEDGTIVDNPNPKWAITQSTRDMVRETIHGGLRDNIGSDAIIRALEDSFAFSPARAEMISRTEIASANSDAAMTSYHEARAAGIDLRKEWILGPNPCEICQENADAGPIGLDETFPSGDDSTPAHPNCECATIAVVEEDNSVEED